MAQITLRRVREIRESSQDPTVNELCDAVERLYARLSAKNSDPKYALVAIYGDGYTECYADEGVKVRYVLFPAHTDRLDECNDPIIHGLPWVYRGLIEGTNPVATDHAKGCPTRSSLALAAIYRDSIESLNEVAKLCSKGDGAV